MNDTIKVTEFEYPSEDWLKDQAYRSTFTPDIIKLEQKANVLVFVWNELQSSFTKNWMVANHGKYCGTMFTFNKYTMFTKECGGYPEDYPVLVEEIYTNVEPLKIKGECWSIPVPLINDLDSYMLNTVEYIRRKERVIYPHRMYWEGSDRKIHNTGWRHSIYWAQMYMGNSKYWAQLIDAGFHYKPTKAFEIPKVHALSVDHLWSEFLVVDKYYSWSHLEKSY